MLDAKIGRGTSEGIGEEVVCVARRAVSFGGGRSNRGKLQRQDMTNLTHAAATVSKWSFHIEDAVDLTAAGIRELLSDSSDRGGHLPGRRNCKQIDTHH